MKAIIEVVPPGAIFRAVQQQLAESTAGESSDFQLSFESVGALIANLTPERLGILDALERVEPCPLSALLDTVMPGAQDLRGEIAALESLGRLGRGDSGDLIVPYRSVEVTLPLTQVV